MLSQVGTVTTNGLQQQTIFASTANMLAFGAPTPGEAARHDEARLAVATKCTFCVERIDEGLAAGKTPGVDPEATPACVNSCIAGALAFGEIAVLWLMILATSVAFWRVRPAAGALLLPYLAWVSFAAVLTLAMWQRNPGVLG